MQETKDQPPAKQESGGRVPAGSASAEGSQSRFTPGEGLPPLTGVMRPAVDLVAHLKLSIHTKLFLGFLISVFLLLALGGLSVWVISNVGRHVDRLAGANELASQTARMQYLVTTRNSLRGLQLMTKDPSYGGKLAEVQREIAELLNALEEQAPPNRREGINRLREIQARYAKASEEAQLHAQQGDIPGALRVRLEEMDPISQEMEASMQELVQLADLRFQVQVAGIQTRHDQLRLMVLVISVASILVAIVLGFILSRSMIRPVQAVNRVLASVAAGDFSQRVELPNRDEFGTLGSNLNTTSQRLSTLYEQLQQELAERQRAEDALRRQANELTALNKELEAFSYSVSHDLRAPLRSINGFSQALHEDYAGKLDAEGQDHLVRILRASQRMGELIDDLLSLSRVTRSEMRPAMFDLGAVAQAIAVDLQKTQPQRQVEFVIAQGVQVQGDAQLLRAALENLLGNAWKFTGKHPHARIEFGVAQHNGQAAYFVRDDGAGFDMAYADKLFGAFQRLHGANEFDGTGIGLATVQRIIHRHGGRIWAESAIEQGATFFFTLS